MSAALRKRATHSHRSTQKTCLSGVYIDMHIYLITNLVNGKRYVGRTERKDPTRRWTEHRSVARNNELPPCIVDRAIRKYGEANFTYEIVEHVENAEDLPARESHYISFYDTINPKGYNLEHYHPRRVLHDSTRQALTIRLQGVRRSPNRTSRFIGVHKDGDLYLSKIAKSNTRYTYRFSTEDEAAQAYDHMALLLYGKRAKVNFQESRALDRTQLKKTYELFTAPKQTSMFRGVCYISTIRRWRGDVQLEDGTTRSRLATTEREAAQFVDVVNVLFNRVPVAKLNFPELYARYQGLTVEWLNKKTPIQGGGVTKDRGRYRARIGNGGKIAVGTFATREEAVDAVAVKRIELGMVWDL